MGSPEGSSGAGQQYNLKWTNHTNNILEMFSEQLLNGMLVDVTLFCEGQYIRAHKMVLSACSPYFQDLFRVHTIDHPVIIMNGARFVAVKQMVDFMYQGEIKVSDADLDHLLTIAENLQIKGLCKIRRENNEGGTSTETPQISKQEVNNDGSLPKKRKRRKLSRSPGGAIEESQTNGGYISNQSLESFHEDNQEYIPNKPAVKITRPKNAFMIFAGEWRKKLQSEHPNENNKDISVRLGIMWKNFSDSEKDEYFAAAKKGREMHRLKYPDYHLAKAAKAALRQKRKVNVRTVKRKKSVTIKEDNTDEAEAELEQASDPAPPSTRSIKKESTDSNAALREEPDDNNLVMAETHSNDSFVENSENVKP